MYPQMNKGSKIPNNIQIVVRSNRIGIKIVKVDTNFILCFDKRQPKDMKVKQTVT